MDLWDGNMDFVINSCNIRTKVVDLCDNLIHNYHYCQILMFYLSYYYHYYKLCLVLAKKNVQDERSGLDIYNAQHDTSFVTIQPDDFYDYMKISCNNAICILDCQFLNPIGRITYYRSTQKIVGEMLLRWILKALNTYSI